MERKGAAMKKTKIKPDLQPHQVHPLVMPQGASTKALAFRVLEEMIARNSSRAVCPIRPAQVGQDCGGGHGHPQVA